MKRVKPFDLAKQSAAWVAEVPRSEAAFTFGGDIAIDFGECWGDLYVFPATLEWTMVFTHEHPTLGPYFSRRGWAEEDPRAGGKHAHDWPADDTLDDS